MIIIIFCNHKDKEFDPDFVRSKSAAAAGLCSWVINIIKFYEVGSGLLYIILHCALQVYCDVAPKRIALEEANQQLADAQSKLQGIIEKVGLPCGAAPYTSSPGNRWNSWRQRWPS